MFPCLKDASIVRATSYLLVHLEKLDHPRAVTITVYCLAVCLPKETDHSESWEKLLALSTRGRTDSRSLFLHRSRHLQRSVLPCSCFTRSLVPRGKWLLPVDDWPEPGPSEACQRHYGRQHGLCPASCSGTWEKRVDRPNSLLVNHPGKLLGRLQIVPGCEKDADCSPGSTEMF